MVLMPLPTTKITPRKTVSSSFFNKQTQAQINKQKTASPIHPYYAVYNPKQRGYPLRVYQRETGVRPI